MNVLGKIALGAAGAVGAIVLAPVVLPAAAAIGTAATAAVGTAAAAAASTTVGTAAIGAMATVGTAVGTTAGAVGLGSVATVAGTSAGAAAIGTIATSGVIGATSAVSGASKMKKASDIKQTAENIYDMARDDFDKKEAKANEALEKLGRTKLDSWELLANYVTVVDKITHIDFDDKLSLDGSLKLDANELKNIKILAMSVTDVLKGGAAALTGGQLVGFATSTGFTSIATASTGTAIASLHGAAASNAALAALGGGAKAVGGLGMAGGASVLSALTLAPAMAIGGMFINGKGKQSLKNANEIKDKAEELSAQLDVAGKELVKLKNLANKICKALEKNNELFRKYLLWLEKLTENKTDFREYEAKEKLQFKCMFELSKKIKDIATTELMNKDNDIQTTNVNNVLAGNKEMLEKFSFEYE